MNLDGSTVVLVMSDGVSEKSVNLAEFRENSVRIQTNFLKQTSKEYSGPSISLSEHGSIFFSMQNGNDNTFRGCVRVK